MRLAFRCDWGPGIGVGHLGRCLAMAEEAMSLGMSTLLLTTSAGLPALPGIHGVEVLDIAVTRPTHWDLSSNPDPTSPGFLEYELADADAVLRAVRAVPIDVLVLDHYFLGDQWVRRVQSAVPSVCVFDDIDRSWVSADFLVDPRPGTNGDQRLQSGGVSICGSKFFPAARSIRDARWRWETSVIDLSRITVFTGGSDGSGLTTKFLRALKPLKEVLKDCRVIVGSSSPDRETIRAECRSHSWISESAEVSNIAEVYATSSLVLGAGGVSSMDRCCLGVPQVVCSVSQNQVSQCRQLADAGGLIYLGEAESATPESITSKIEYLLNDHEASRDISESARNQVDEYGASRILLLLRGNVDSLRMRPCEWKDVHLLYRWANDPLVRENSTNIGEISWHEHKAWFSAVLKRSSAFIYIVESYGVPLGQLRLERSGDTATLSYLVDSDFRGRGVGAYIVSAAVQEARQLGIGALRAVVRCSNLPSARIFRSSGFSETNESNAEFMVFSRALQL